MNVKNVAMAGAFAQLVLAAGVPVLAQSTNMGLGRATAQPCTSAPVFILITYPHAPDKRTAERAQEEVRQAVNSTIPKKDVCVVDKARSDQMLTTSGFKTDSVLSTLDNAQLAQQMRADEIIEFEVLPSGPGGKSFQMIGRLVLARDINLRDSVPKPDVGESMSQSAKWLVKNLVAVRAQLEHEQKCLQLSREGKFAEAEKEARAGIAAFPPATISRACLAVALQNQKKPPQEILAVVEEMRKHDPNNALALRIALDAYLAANDHEKYADVAAHLVTIDPTSSAMETIVDNLAIWKLTDKVIPIIHKALEADPDNKNLRLTEFRITYRGDKYKEAAALGEALSKIDTSAVDTLFTQYMISAYYQDSQPNKMLEWIAKGVQKFPNNISFAKQYAQQLKNMGRTQDAINAYINVLNHSPKEPEIRLRIAQYYGDAGQQDSSLAWLKKASEAGVDSKETISQLIYAMGLKALQAAQASKDIEDYKKVIPLVALSDSVFANDNAKLYWGLSALQIGFGIYQQKIADPNKPTCPDVKDSGAWLDIANEKVRAGAKANPQQAGGYMNNILQIQQVLQQVSTQLKCT
ncbi:MAG TPA: hypothetical protein VE967_04240 [Gemmatimonadaceae bacterium]|nr:hypothetical protein [Gemmatimonadaceae bacterium]